ncbi:MULTISPECIES: hypothetical protein [unclassified Microcoleus]|uniref:hypothetical protein n=1 Tax=unclassified Microcoleus TaxID=2642155 RepID=UPI002FD6F06F
MLLNLKPAVSTPLTDADIPAAIARDAEVTGAIAAHAAATDPHPAYLTQPEGDSRYLQTGVVLADTDIPASIARDSEVVAAVAAHAAALDPHAQYLTQAEFLTSDFFFQVSAPNLIANTWQDIGPLIVLGEQGKPTAWLITLYFQYSADGNSLVGWHQYSGSGILGCIFWKAGGLSDGVPIIVDAHVEFPYTVRVRGGLNQGRKLQLNPDRNISLPAPGFLRVYMKKLL